MNEIIYIQECESTNSALFEINEIRKVKGLPLYKEGTVLTCGFQSRGRGQRGNQWYSEKGENLLFSLLLYPSFLEAKDQFIITQLVSVGVKNCLKEYIEDVTIKWPNDIYWKDKKIGGILIENILLENRIEQSIIGIGLNINQEKFEDFIPNPVSLKNITNRIFDLNSILKDIQINILRTYNKVAKGETVFLIEDYKSSLYRSDGYYPYIDKEGEFFARIIDVDSLGALILETNRKEIKHFSFKEVSFVI